MPFARRRRIAALLLGLVAVVGAPQAASAQAVSEDDIEVDGRLPGGSDPAPASPQTALLLLGGAAALAVLVRRSAPRRGTGGALPSGDDFGGGDPVLDLTEPARQRVAV